MATPSRPPSQTALEYAAVTALTLAVCFLLYGPRWLAGQTVFRGVIQEQYYLLGQSAFDHLIRTDFAAGRFPLWNPLNALGTPLLGNMLSGVFYPLKAFIYAFPGDAARDVYIIARLVIAALFTFALARRLRLSFFPAALAALAFAFTGYFKMFVNENYLNADVLLPGLVLFALRLAQEHKKRDLAALALLVFAALNNGHPEAAFYTLLLPAFLVLAQARGLGEWRRASVLFGAAVGAGLILSLPLLLPFFEYWFRGYHFHVPGAGFFHYSARQISALASPWFFGPAPPGAPFLGRPDFTWAEGSGMPGYGASAVPWLAPALGVMPLFFMLIAVSRARQARRWEAALLLYAVFFAGVMFGLPLFRLIGYLPVFSQSGNFKHPGPGVALAVALLAGRGAELALRREVSATRVANILIIMTVAVLALGVVREPIGAPSNYLNGYSMTVLAIFIGAGAWLTWYCASGRGGPGRAKDRAKDRAGRRVLGFVTGTVIVTAAGATLVLDGFQQPMRDPGYEARLEGSAALARLDQLAPLARVYVSQDLFPPNLNILFNIADLRVMDGVNDRRLVSAINRINGHDRAQAGDYWYRGIGYLQPRPDRLGHPLLELFNVGYALTAGPLPYNRSADLVHDPATRTLAPGPDHLGTAKFPWDHGTAPGLYQHPPSQVALELSPDQAGADGAILIRFRPALLPSSQAREPDGVWLSIFHQGRLIYGRSIHPRGQPSDAAVPATSITRYCRDDQCGRLILASLPGPTTDFDQAGWADFRLGGAEAADPGPWTEMVAGSPRLYHNPRARPRVFLVARAEAADEDAALARLAEGSVDPSETVLISGASVENHAGPAAPGPGAPGLVEAIDYGPQRVAVRCTLRTPGWLVAGDLSYPGWRARVDGREERIYRADYCLRGVELGPGAREVVMTYEPVSFRLGLWSALAGLGGLGWLYFGFKSKAGLVGKRLRSDSRDIYF